MAAYNGDAQPINQVIYISLYLYLPLEVLIELVCVFIGDHSRFGSINIIDIIITNQLYGTQLSSVLALLLIWSSASTVNKSIA